MLFNNEVLKKFDEIKMKDEFRWYKVNSYVSHYFPVKNPY